jgi:hypothetical protein
MVDEVDYLETRGDAVFFEAPHFGMTFDVPRVHEVRGEVFIVDETCNCFLTRPESDEPDEMVFIAQRGDKLLVVGMIEDDDGNAGIEYKEILRRRETLGNLH